MAHPNAICMQCRITNFRPKVTRKKRKKERKRYFKMTNSQEIILPNVALLDFTLVQPSTLGYVRQQIQECYLLLLQG